MIRSRSADADGRRGGQTGLLAFAMGLSVATLALVLLAFTAVAEMRRSANLLMERRASEVLALASAALTRDMKGAWLSVLVPMDATIIQEDPPYDLLQLTSRAFARFPYPESFIVWTADGTPGGRTYVLSRSDRPLPWDAMDRDAEPYPVTLRRDPAALEPLVAQIRRQAAYRRRFALVETTFAGVPYQAIVHFLFAPPDDTRLAGLVAFTVNLDWVRREYLSELLRQVATLDGEHDAMAIAVLDERQQVVATSGVESTATPMRQRNFPLLFFEPALMSSLPPERPAVRQWTAQVRPARNTTSAASVIGAQLVLLASLAGAASLVAVVLTVRTVRTRAQLATMKSEFVSAVTHELKTPLALIKLVGETLERGRYTSSDTIREYAKILSQEERRLSHLIENLLTYSRLSDLEQMYAVEPVDPSDLVDEALEPFRPRLRELGFQLNVAIDPDLPHIRGDRSALLQVVTNIIDNAIKYSPEQSSLEIAARAVSDRVHMTFTDTGSGIAADEIPKVFDKFYRGRDASEAGSGLGLAIVRRIVEQHGGSVEVRSAVGKGTTIELALPVAQRR